MLIPSLDGHGIEIIYEKTSTMGKRLMSALIGIGGGLGVVLAGVIVDNLNYHYLFWIPLVAIGASTLASRSAHPGQRITSGTRTTSSCSVCPCSTPPRSQSSSP